MLNQNIQNTKEQKPSESKTTANLAQEKNPYRLNLTLNADAKNELEILKTKAQKSSFVDVLRAAITVYKVVIEHQEAGGRVIFRKQDNTEEVLRFV